MTTDTAAVLIAAAFAVLMGLMAYTASERWLYRTFVDANNMMEEMR